VRTVPASGRLVVNAPRRRRCSACWQRGCWTPVQRFGTDGAMEPGGLRGTRRAACLRRAARQPEARPRGAGSCIGEHNQMNALAAIGAAEHAGVRARAVGAPRSRASSNVKRRLELRGEVRRHARVRRLRPPPHGDRSTARAACAAQVGAQRILAVFEPRSNTMKLGTMKAQLPWALEDADAELLPAGRLRLERRRGAGAAWAPLAEVCSTVEALVARVARRPRARRPACCA
jgi:UDP-N-acetylmuramate: L-alanyl-gamma-D-glutamyl-meso-diaminopimelate ligase